jgi:hypothetical protein
LLHDAANWAATNVNQKGEFGMKFYLVSQLGQDIDCRLRKSEAIVVAKSIGESRVAVHEMDIPVTAESIRRLLGDLGGYAKKAKCVYSI